MQSNGNEDIVLKELGFIQQKIDNLSGSWESLDEPTRKEKIAYLAEMASALSDDMAKDVVAGYLSQKIEGIDREEFSKAVDLFNVKKDNDSPLYGGIKQSILDAGMLRDDQAKNAKTKSIIKDVASLSPLDQETAIQWMSQSGLGGKAALASQLRTLTASKKTTNGAGKKFIELPKGSPENWRNSLLRNKDGNPTENMSNYMTILSHHEDWKGKLWWDDVKCISMIGDKPISDHVIADIALWLGIKEKLAVKAPKLLEKCIQAVSENVRRDPIVEWIDNLPEWDKVQRLNRWLIVVAGAEDTKLNEFISKSIIMSMIARGITPGCILRLVAILEGVEGTGKTKLVRALGGDWYTDFSLNMDNKEAKMILRGSWVAELAELDSLKKSEESRTKAFLTDTVDRFVPKYSNNTVAYPRRTVFVGTTNEYQYLRSTTGNTRFMPVKTGDKINVELFLEMRDQIFAEGIALYRVDSQGWWELPPELETKIQQTRHERRPENIYENQVKEWLEDREETSLREVMETCLSIGISAPEKLSNKLLQMQVSEAMKACGWKRGPKKQQGGVRVCLWIPGD